MTNAATNRKPFPLFLAPQRAHCPVCGEISYSAAGIHPQCAVQQADLNHGKPAKLRVPAEKTTTDSVAKPWQRQCPKCRAVVHVRLKVCECGHEFAQHSARR